ncbi:MAG TPA: hypothetical protein VFV89_21630 [Nocardioides sp.]|uniref:hypothetical protein n=1 Tax=Nocardioides sp. TaxID=35761 RepID=UPI002E30CD35|nr:hypothetical protein [Nocardioides sp.]HEX5090426.1 hypothetical protein [Nocardioides sp.]
MRLRFPEVGAGGRLYESVYAVLVHPDQPRALWLRTTVQKRPGQAAMGALWVTWFDEAGVKAGKLTGLSAVPVDEGLECGPARQGPDGTRGSIDLDSLAATWDISFTPRAQPLEHLAPAVLYRAPLPRTKATSPVPDLGASGDLAVDGTAVDLAGWTGMLGHNWGTEHAARWIWLRAGGLGEDGSGWLDAVLARVRVGPALTPWTGFGALTLDGERHRLGGLLSRGTRVELLAEGARVMLTGRGIRVGCHATVALTSTVGWEYADPGGHRHEVVNCSVATTRADVEQAGRRVELQPDRRGVLEVGGDTRAFDVPLQPFAD